MINDTIEGFAEKYLPPPIRNRYLNNCYKLLRYDNDLQKTYNASFANFVLHTFHKEVSPEGSEYWRMISKQFND
jgi:hypothetical protein